MIKRLKFVGRAERPSIKKLMSIIVVIGLLVMPDTLLHLVAVVAHTLYESIAFAIEELLVHGFGFNKERSGSGLSFDIFFEWNATMTRFAFPALLATVPRFRSAAGFCIFARLTLPV